MAVWRQESKVRAAALRDGWRSGLEQEIAAWLESKGIDPKYEQETITYTKPARKSRYRPDFPIITKGTGKKIYIETKGQFKAADRQKHLLIKEQHPELDIRFVFSRSASRISKQSKTTYADWCEKHGFQYADKQIPEEWLEE